MERVSSRRSHGDDEEPYYHDAAILEAQASTESDDQALVRQTTSKAARMGAEDGSSSASSVSSAETASQIQSSLQQPQPQPQQQLRRRSPLRGQSRALPQHWLGRGFRTNAYFANRLRNIMMVIALIDLCGIVAFWGTKRVENGGLYVYHVFKSLIFKKAECTENSDECRSCNTLISYSAMVYHMLPIVVMMGLPASGWRVFDPFKRDAQTLGDRRRNENTKIVRTLYLQACELFGVLVVLCGVVVFFYFIYSLFMAYSFNCNKLRVYAFVTGAVFCYFAMFVELTYFSRFREHLKMQLGAFQEADQTGNVRARFANRSWHCRSDNHHVKTMIRKRLYKLAQLGDIRELNNALEEAKDQLGPDFAVELFKNPKIWCRFFGRSKKNPLHIAALRGNIPAMIALVDAGFLVNSYDKVERLRLSTGDIFWYFARFFISKPLSEDEDAVSLFRTTLVTPLHCAVSTGQIDAVKWLIQHSADVNLRSKSSDRSERLPPLFMADNSEIVSLLVDAGANILEVPDPGRLNTVTVLQLAYIRKNVPVALELEKRGGDVALTPLHTAVASNNEKRVRKFLKHGADPNCLGEQGYCGMFRRTPLHWGAVNGAAEAVKALLAADADPNFQDIHGRTPLHWAARVNRESVVTLLLKKGADPNIRDSWDMTPIMCASQSPDVNEAIFKKLVEHGADINDQMSNGDTTLHVAMKSEHLNTALSLLACGADIMRTNREGLRPVDCTTSTKLQFEVKRAAGNRDVMISYTHTHIEFAQKLRKSLVDANITTWLDQMDPTGIGGGSVWREEIARGIRNASLVLCILSEDYAKSEWCLKELALAKECGTPIIGVSVEHARITEELQVYLYTRQLVPFEPAIASADRSDPTSVTFKYDEARYAVQFRNLLDGARDEIEKRRKDSIRRVNPRQISDQLSANDQFLIPELDMSTVLDEFVFICHGDHHRSFALRVCQRMSESGVRSFLDGSHSLKDMQLRIHLAKEAILRCSCFIVILSNRTVDSELVRDQLAFAEDKGRPIIPIMLNELELRYDTLYTLSRTPLFHFTPELGFNASMTPLLASVHQHLNHPASSSGGMGGIGGVGHARSVPSLFNVANAAMFPRRAKNRHGGAPLLGTLHSG